MVPKDMNMVRDLGERGLEFLIQIKESPDLNPIKFVWDEVDIGVRREYQKREREVFSAWKMIGKKQVFVKQ